MSDPVIRRVRRAIDEAKNRGGMQAGMPKVTIDAGDAERLCIVAEALATTQAENEALRKRAVELEADNAHQRGRRNAARKCIADMKGPWLLRKQAEAVEEAVVYALRTVGNVDPFEVDIHRFANDCAQRLRQQADEAERAGGEK